MPRPLSEPLPWSEAGFKDQVEGRLHCWAQAGETWLAEDIIQPCLAGLGIVWPSSEIAWAQQIVVEVA
ncbi:MAG TPA: hypothetical protein VGO22_00875 [Pseudorhizobium sp.]|nr:hypothetical protein [Pseudorhizobium sp.]